jgi:peptidoglycan/LPS O-acetylase OafA/YrhL
LLSLLFSGPFFYVVLVMKIPYFAYFQTHLASTIVLVLTMFQSWVPMAALGWNGVAWAVSVEIFFYILFPLLLSRFSRTSNRDLASLALICWMLAVATALAYVVLTPDDVVANSSTDFLFWLSALKFHPLMRLPEFIVGLACGYWYVRGWANPKLATPLVLGGTLVVLIMTTFSHFIPYPIMHTGLYAPAFAAIIYGLALRPRWTSFLESRLLVLLGESSYCLYLLHVTILGLFLYPNLKHNATPSLGKVLCAAATAIVVGVLAFRFVEDPARKWLRGKGKATPVCTTAAA